MRIVVRREKTTPEYTAGWLSIDNEVYAYTLERTEHMLQPGEYEIDSLTKMYLWHGNGIYNVKDHRILVGEKNGCCDDDIIHSYPTYRCLYKAIAHQLKKGREVMLDVEGPPDPRDPLQLPL